MSLEMVAIERALIIGDLSQLNEEQRLTYYRRVCESLGLNPLTRPFEYLRLNGRLVLYATRSCADQLRAIHRISLEIVSQQQVGDSYVVHVRASTPDGRVDEDLGVVSIRGLEGDALANAVLKAITKAKRRVTLSIVGLGWLDETEVETIPGAERVTVENHAEPPRQALPAVEDAESERRHVLERGARILQRMREREREQGVPVQEQLEFLIEKGYLGLYIAKRLRAKQATDQELAAALGSLNDGQLRALAAFCDEHAKRG